MDESKLAAHENEKNTSAIRIDDILTDNEKMVSNVLHMELVETSDQGQEKITGLDKLIQDVQCSNRS